MTEGICPYCDTASKTLTKDHIVPKVMGNRGHKNIIRVCNACNQKKGNMLPEGMILLAEAMEREAQHYRDMAAIVQELIDARGLLKPFPGSQ